MAHTPRTATAPTTACAVAQIDRGMRSMLDNAPTSLVALCVVDGQIKEIGRAHIGTTPTGRTVHAIVSIGPWNGTGKTNGYGYHKPSAALSEALGEAGFVLSSSIHSVGHSAMIDGFRAACEAWTAQWPAVGWGETGPVFVVEA